MKARFIQWLVTLLAKLGYAPCISLQQMVFENQKLQEWVIHYERREASRKARSAILLEVINGLLPYVSDIANAPQSFEWKRHQLFTKSIRQFPKISQPLAAIGADYALYYGKHGHLELNGDDIS